jgi:hypothetical protein
MDVCDINDVRFPVFMNVVKSTTRWPRIVLSHVETTQTALENTQTHTDYQDYNMVSEVLE